MSNRTLEQIVDISKSYDKAKYRYADFVLLLCYIVSSKKTITINENDYTIKSFKDLVEIKNTFSKPKEFVEKLVQSFEYIFGDEIEVYPCGRWNIYCLPFENFPNEYIDKLFEILSNNEMPLQTVEDYEYLVNSIPLDYVETKILSEKNNVSKLINKLSEKKKNQRVLDVGTGSGVSILNSVHVDPFGHLVIEPETYGIQRLTIADALFSKKKTIIPFDDDFIQEYLNEDSETPLDTFDVATYNRPLSKEDTSIVNASLESGDNYSQINFWSYQPLRSSNEDEIHVLNNLTHNIKSKVVMVVSNNLLYKKHPDYSLYREGIIYKNYLEAVIQLPKNIFKYSHSSYSIIVINKNKKDDKYILVDLSKNNKYINTKGISIKDEAIDDIYELVKNKTKTKDTKILNKEELDENNLIILPEMYISSNKKELKENEIYLNEQEIYEQLNEINNRILELTIKMKGEY